MWEIAYYTRPNERQPVSQWREEQQKEIRASIDARADKLAHYGLELLNTKILKKISGVDRDFYELRDLTFGWRIAVYFDRPINTFVLLHAWRKQKRLEKRAIAQSRRFLHEYLNERG